MIAIEVARRIAGCFDEDGIAYAIGGALALGVWGAPRGTKDVDISVFLPVAALDSVLDSLERAGAMVDRLAAARGVERIGLFNAWLGKTAIDVFVSEHPHFAELRRRARRIVDHASGQPMSFMSAEDVVLYKLVFGRGKDVVDLERLLAVRRELDLAYVRSWLGQMVPAGDRRFAILDDLERRFSRH